MPVISVIIPALNRRDTLGRAIRSVHNQIYDDCEIIVIDDGSTDGTADFARSLSGSDIPIRVIEHGYNRGVSAARNTGIRAARGEWIAFFDGDDEWNEMKLLEQISALRKTGAAGKKTFCLTYYTRRLPDGAIRIAEKFLHDKGPPEHRIEDGLYVRTYLDSALERKVASWELWLAPGSTLFAHRDAIAANGFFLEHLGRGEDTEYITRHIMRGAPLHVIPGFLAIYSLPEPGKIYARADNYQDYMIGTYAEAIGERWNLYTKESFIRRLEMDRRATREIWEKAAVESGVPLLKPGQPYRSPPSGQIRTKDMR